MNLSKIFGRIKKTKVSWHEECEGSGKDDNENEEDSKLSLWKM
jgi:hypothetical protein